LVHCVAEDMLMGQGIAVEFRRKFHRLGELLNQHCKSGELAVLTEPNRFIYYLVTKNFSYSKPLMCNLENSVLQLKEHCVRHNVTHLCMPLIGCGRDQLSWSEVKKFLIETFSGTDIRISVYKIDKVITLCIFLLLLIALISRIIMIGLPTRTKMKIFYCYTLFFFIWCKNIFLRS
jgi:O-acetyl-ADP-ribose deacetylase (regulator of RNase III)